MVSGSVTVLPGVLWSLFPLICNYSFPVKVAPSSQWFLQKYASVVSLWESTVKQYQNPKSIYVMNTISLLFKRCIVLLQEKVRHIWYDLLLLSLWSLFASTCLCIISSIFCSSIFWRNEVKLHHVYYPFPSLNICTRFPFSSSLVLFPPSVNSQKYP